MGADRPKQYLSLAGRTLLEWSVQALLADARVEHVTVVIAPGDDHARRLRLPARATLADTGGPSRAESVRNGLRALLAQDDDFVLVHDAARPCLAREELAALIDAVDADRRAGDEQGGILALAVADTLKRESDGRVGGTVERAGLWRALTPQMFRAGLLARALESVPDPAAITDEAAAVERLGFRPRLVAGLASNLKVTTPQDWALAEAILRAQGKTPGATAPAHGP
ncbi:MAG TPA: 2-C-methyl-D-erythritol 4-phosphate cytidylyltransferase [Burkholderiaceae bacterium]